MNGVSGDNEARFPWLAASPILDRSAGGETWDDGTPIRTILRPEDDSDTIILKTSFKGIEPALAKAHAARGVPVAATNQKALDMAEAIPGCCHLSDSDVRRRLVKSRDRRGVAAATSSVFAGA